MRNFTDGHYRKMREAEMRQRLERFIASKEFKIMGRKTTVCLLVLKNGIELTGTSCLIEYDNFNVQIGEYYAYENALHQLKILVGMLEQAGRFE